MIVYGKQIFLYILDNFPNIINTIFLTKEIDKKLFNRIKKYKIVKLDNKKAQSLARGGNHQGFLVDIDFELNYTLDDLKDDNFIILLDNVTDMGNIGSIIRTSYALGVDSVIICSKDLKLDTIIRTSSAAALSFKFINTPNCLDTINQLKQKGFKIYCSSLDGIDVKKIKKDKKMVLVLGSEGFGISKKILNHSDLKVKIEMKNNFDSLNVAVACGILAYNFGD